MSFEELGAIKRYGYDFWKQNAYRLPGRVATAEMAIIWYEKKEFVKKAIEMNPYGSDVYLWVDVGCIRGPSWTDKEKYGRVKYFEMEKNKIYIGAQGSHKVQDENGLYTYPTGWIAGAIIAGYKEAWLDYYDKYDKVVQRYIDAKVSPAEDQDVMASMTHFYPDLVVAVPPLGEANEGGGAWFEMLWRL